MRRTAKQLARGYEQRTGVGGEARTVRQGFRLTPTDLTRLRALAMTWGLSVNATISRLAEEACRAARIT